MTTLILAEKAAQAAGSYSIGSAVGFYITAAFMVVCALFVALSKRATHSAIAMVGVMLGLAVIYFMQGAMFLSVVQIVVYTGAIMILFLFVLMLVGVAASDNYHKTRPALRIAAWVMGIAGAGLLGFAAVAARIPAPKGIDYTYSVDNPVMLAFVMFGEHMFTIEVTGALLILAAIGAVTLTHSDALVKVKKQPETAQSRLQLYAAAGVHPGQLPAPGVYARNNAPDTPAISGEDQKPVIESVPRALRAQGNDRALGQVAPKLVMRVQAEHLGRPEEGVHTFEANRAVAQSQSWGMPGAASDMSLAQPETRDVRPRALKGGDDAVKAVETEGKEADQ